MASIHLSLSTNSSPPARAAALVHAVYGQFVPDLTLSHADSLALESPKGKVTALADIVTALVDAAGKTNDALGNTPQQQDAAKHFLAKLDSPSLDSPDSLKAIDTDLTTKTYCAGESLTAADLGLFAAVHPHIAQASHSTLLSHPALTRHFDHVQHLPLVASALARNPDLLEGRPALVAIDVDNVPVVEVKPDVKPKKPKADAAAAAAPAAAADKQQKQAPVDKVVSDKKKGEQAGAPATAGAAKDGASKKGDKKDKPPKEKKAPAPAPVAEAPAPWMVDLRVGKIVEVSVHPDADSLYVEKIDVGEAEPRTILSGLVKYKTLEQMQGAMVITVCNLKPVSMRGIKSFGMLLCATSPEGKDAGVEFVDPPAGSEPGDRVYFEGMQDRTALELLNPKKKIFETVQPGFTTLANREAAWVADAGKGETHRIVTDKGVCCAPTYVGASLS
ncbi:uncharacterized protein RHOBADRAFT_53436 [Rhodotorula graminis WP1]|uniref:tRNA-binding domain-containing protein n=1 Tax=Rhodotorula graminis (strain WP1) TaxID=578459 RepID=A0A194S4F4_RHOGW|nr:uncharacterized protein RHOBADRAFT_53436 [Rhodotorula graminis WP1]KPV75462.1 hypothetical protein RHOBADRAFT_53436 [Rhodotorula graminis WP1]